MIFLNTEIPKFKPSQFRYYTELPKFKQSQFRFIRNWHQHLASAPTHKQINLCTVQYTIQYTSYAFKYTAHRLLQITQISQFSRFSPIAQIRDGKTSTWFGAARPVVHFIRTGPARNTILILGPFGPAKIYLVQCSKLRILSTY